jgi:four helix bundle protein
VVWQKAHEFVLAVYRLTESFPDREKFGLSHQMRRAAVSIPANIAEGFGKRQSSRESSILEHCGRFGGGVPLLPDPHS